MTSYQLFHENREARGDEGSMTRMILFHGYFVGYCKALLSNANDRMCSTRMQPYSHEYLHATPSLLLCHSYSLVKLPVNATVAWNRGLAFSAWISTLLARKRSTKTVLAYTVVGKLGQLTCTYSWPHVPAYRKHGGKGAETMPSVAPHPSLLLWREPWLLRPCI